MFCYLFAMQAFSNGFALGFVENFEVLSQQYGLLFVILLVLSPCLHLRLRQAQQPLRWSDGVVSRFAERDWHVVKTYPRSVVSRERFLEGTFD